MPAPAVSVYGGTVADNHLEPLRLLKAYRGYRPGQVIRATPQLAGTLKASGIAAPEPQRTFLAADGAERAVEARSNVETR
jgi:hypothetical protein